MNDTTRVTTKGIHHFGLTVFDLEKTTDFFTRLLGWNEVKRDPSYPAVFVSDGTIMITLWALKLDDVNRFDKNRNVGLHHLALEIESMAALTALYEKLNAEDLEIEFSPESLRESSTTHMMVFEPGGIRIEFICVPADK